MNKEQEYQKQLAAQRNKGLKDFYAGSKAQAEKSTKQYSGPQRARARKDQLEMARRLSAKKALSSKADLAKSAKELPLAFTAVDLSKDGMHFVVIMVSVIADLFTFIPVAGSFFALLFSVIIWVLYAISGHLKKKVGRKVVVTSVSQAAEVFGVVINMFPFFTASAIINYLLALADRKAAQK